jgi:ribosomal protein L11 methylase PrmA
VVGEFLDHNRPSAVWDLGANTGVFSRLASQRAVPTVAWDVDPGAVELNYRQVVQNGETHILPLVLDLTNPSGALGWANNERMSFIERGPTDMIMALALIHHLAISNNVPLDNIARLLSTLCRCLIIEFVPKQDKKVQTLLATRVDIFKDYTEAGFEAAFSRYFSIERRVNIQASERVMYLMVTK